MWGAIDAAVALVALVVSLAVYGFHPLTRWRYRHIPGPPPKFLLGNLAEMVALGQHEAYRTWAKKYGSVFKVWLGAFPVVVTEDAAAARRVNTRLAARHPVPLLEVGAEARLNALSILFASGDLWRGMRSAWQPMFHSGSLEGFTGLMQRRAEALTEVLGEAAASGRALDIVSTFNAMTMEVVGETAYGVDFDILRRQKGGAAAAAGGDAQTADETAQLVDAMRAFFQTTGKVSTGPVALMLVVPALAPLIRWAANALPSREYRQALEARALIRRISAGLLRRARGADPGQARVAGRGVAPGSFMGLLTRANNKATGLPFSDFEVVANSFFFMVAGNETTSTALTFAVYLLATHPAAEAALLAEVDAFGREKAPGFADLGSFPYVDAVLKEALRLFPPVHLTARQADADVLMAGHRVPAGTPIQVSLYGMHRSPHYWRDPDAFVPERFLEGVPQAAGNDLGAYQPFGDGPRGCIGSAYATQEVRIALVTIYQKFRFRLAPGAGAVPVRTTITLAPAATILLKVLPR